MFAKHSEIIWRCASALIKLQAAALQSALRAHIVPKNYSEKLKILPLSVRIEEHHFVLHLFFY